MALGATLKMVDALHDLDTSYRILLTIVPPKLNKAGMEAKSALANAILKILILKPIVRKGFELDCP